MTDLLDPTILPALGSTDQEEWDELAVASDVGVAQVRTSRTIPRWLVTYVWELPSGDNLKTIRSFFRTQKGMSSEFYAFTVDPYRWWPDVSCGTGDGSNRIFPMRGRNIQTSPAAIVKVAGTTKTLDADYQIVSSDTITNMLTDNQSDIEGTATDGWTTTGSGSTVTKSATYKIEQSNSMKVVVVNTSNAGFVTDPAQYRVISVGATYTFTAWVRSDTVSTPLRLYLSFYTSGGADVNQVYYDFTATTTWQRFSVTGIPNATSYYAGGSVRTRDAAATYTWYNDALILNAGTTTVWCLGGTSISGGSYNSNIVFNPDKAPTNGQVVTASYAGTRYILARLTERIDSEIVDYNYVRITANCSGEEV